MQQIPQTKPSHAYARTPLNCWRKLLLLGSALSCAGTSLTYAGAGLSVTYYDNQNFTGLPVSRVDAAIDFDWGGGSPAPGIAPDTFSARWTGQVTAVETGNYTFRTVADDGIRLWVNKQLVVDRWVDQPPTVWDGTISLEGGRTYEIAVEYYENGGGAVARLQWRRPAQNTFQTIPQTQLSNGSGEDIRFPADAGHVDVTKPPYNVIPNDGIDDTAVIQRVLSDTVNSLRIVYFPNGIYNVSDTLRWQQRSGDGVWGDWFPNMSIQGQSEAGVVFKLKDSCPGFTNAGAPRGVIETGGIYDQGGNTAFGNNLRNFTVDVGTGNPGAYGMDYLANNQGMVNNITLKAGANSGAVGLRCFKGIPGPCYLKNITVSGFATGIAAGSGTQYSVVLEHLRLSGQRDHGLFTSGVPISVRNLRSNNSCPAVVSDRYEGLIVLIDSELNGGSPTRSALEYRGEVLLRNVTSAGYANLARQRDSGAQLAGPNVTEWVSSQAFSLFPSKLATLNLPIEETPDFQNEDLSKWVAVGPPLTHQEGAPQFQAAIDRANAEGKDTIYVPWAGRSDYEIGQTVRVWGTVRRIVGMGQDIATRDQVRNLGKPMFLIEDINGPDVTFENFYITSDGDGPIFEHKTTKSLVLRSLLVWDGKAYTNTVTGGKLFVEDVAASGWRINGPQTVFFRQVNCEQDAGNSVDDNGTPTYILNNGATIWAFGLKSERELTTITTRNGGKTELLSGLQYPAREVPSTTPLFIVENASATFSYATEAFWIGGDYRIQVRETRGGVTRDFGSSLSSYPLKAFPRNNGSMVPLFSAVASVGATSGTYKLINKNSGKALDVSGVSTSDGATVHQWTYVGGDNQKWRLDELSGADAGFFTITAVHSGKALDVWGASTADGAGIVQWPRHGGDNQKWRVEDVGDGYYRLVAKHSGKVVAIDGGGLGDGARAIQWTYGNFEDHKWQLLPP